jgi:transcriptional regulator
LRLQRHFAIDDPADVRRIVHENGWALLVTQGPEGLHATHFPVLVDDAGGAGDELVVVGHLAAADPQSSDLEAGREALIVVQGPHGYVSPDWYEAGPYVPTWNYAAVHLRGVVEILPGAAGFDVLRRTVEHFESAREQPWQLDDALDYARRIAPATLAFRLRPTSIEAKAKLSQDKPREVQARVAKALDRPGPYSQPALAAEMRRLLDL